MSHQGCLKRNGCCGNQQVIRPDHLPALFQECPDPAIHLGACGIKGNNSYAAGMATPLSGTLKRDHDGITVRVRWLLNRMHYHPRVVRLEFDGFGGLPDADLPPVVKQTIASATRELQGTNPLLLRTTVEAESGLHHALLDYGFFESRRVLEPVLQLDQALTNLRSVESTDGAPRITPLADVTDRDELLDLMLEIYARTSRLDPATPEHFSRNELWNMFTEDVNWQASSCAMLDGELIGLCIIHSGASAGEVELGLCGVRASQLARHQETGLALLLASARAAQHAGARLLRAELDTDDPWMLYLCAELPFRRDTESVSLVFAPNWTVTDPKT